MSPLPCLPDAQDPTPPLTVALALAGLKLSLPPPPEPFNAFVLIRPEDVFTLT